MASVSELAKMNPGPLVVGFIPKTGQVPAGAHTEMSPDIDSMIASTIQSAPPGHKLVLQKNIIWSTKSLIVKVNWHRDLCSPLPFQNKKVGELLQHCLDDIRLQAWNDGCNAVIGLAFTVANDTMPTGIPHEFNKTIVVTATGMPVVIKPENESPAVPVVNAVEIKPQPLPLTLSL